MSGAVAFAFAAGALSTVNPCGFAVLPAFLAYYLRADATAAPAPLTARLARGVGAGFAVSTGFGGIFTVAGLLLAAGLRLIIGVVPWVAAAVGAGLIAIGVLLLVGKTIGITINANGVAGRDGGVRGLVLFGAAYALASLSCTVAVLLAVVGQALAAADVLAVASIFAAYAAGAASVLVLLTVSAALASGALTRAVRRVLPYIGRVSGAVLVLSGAYLLAYWVPQLAGNREGIGLSRGGGAVAGTITEWLGRRTSLIGVLALAAVVVVGALSIPGARRSRRSTAPTDGDCCATEAEGFSAARQLG